MRKFLLVVMVLALTAPAFAAVDVNCTVDGNEVTVQFVNTDPNHVRAFALDIILDNASGFDADWALKFDANVVSIDNLEPNYWVYPGSIDVNTNDNSINSYGSAVADDEKYPDGTLAGLDSNGMTVEMASLYYPVQHNHANAPPDSGVLFTFKVDTCCNLTIRENAKRGGIVMEDPDYQPVVNLPAPLVVDLNKNGTCSTAYGDVNGDSRIRTNDIGTLVTKLTPYTGYRIYYTDPNFTECGDMDGNGWNRTNDIGYIVNLLTPYVGYRIMTLPCP
jgi:hypothetical protein